MKLRLDKTMKSDLFIQEWTIINGSNEHKVISESEWGHVEIVSGGDKKFKIGDHIVTASDIIGITISTIPLITNDGEYCEIDENWIKECAKYGITI